MTEKLVGVATWRPQEQYRAALSATWPDIVNSADGWQDPYRLYDAGTIPFVHPMFKYPTSGNRQIIDEILRGDWDVKINTYLDSIVDYCNTGRKAVLAFLPEANGVWTPYGPVQSKTLSQNYANGREVYRKMVTMARAKGLTKDKVLYCYAPNDVGWGKFDPYFPGDEYLDIFGGSAYNRGDVYDWYAPWRAPNAAIGGFVADVRRLSQKPIVITQTGSGEGDSRTPGWLDQLVAYTLSDTIEGFIWFDIAEYTYQPGPGDFNMRTKSLVADCPMRWFDEELLPEPMEDQGRNQLYVKQGMSGQDVEYWQVQCVMAVKGVKFYGNSNKTFLAIEAPQLTFKEWNKAMTAYLSAWTGRNSYGVGATERIMIERAVDNLYR